MGDNCSSACLTKDHNTWGECVRGKGLRIGYANSASGLDLTKEKKFQKEINEYKDARRQGIQPAGSQLHQVRAAVERSNETGVAFQA